MSEYLTAREINARWEIYNKIIHDLVEAQNKIYIYHLINHLYEIVLRRVISDFCGPWGRRMA